MPKYHKDSEGEVLKEGLYKDTNSERIIYFSGEYTINGKAIVYAPEKHFAIDPETTSNWKRVENPEEYIKNFEGHLNFLKTRVSKLEESLITEENNKPNLSAKTEDERLRTNTSLIQDKSLAKEVSKRLST